MDWQQEFMGIWFPDERLRKRFFATLQSFSDHAGQSIMKACGSWSHAKGTYRLLENPGFNRFQVMELHRHKTIERMSQHPVVLALSDSSTISYPGHFSKEDIGEAGSPQENSKQTPGLMSHTLIAVTPEEVPLGLLDQQIWSRGSFNGKESLKWLNALESGSLKAQADLGQRTKVITVSDRESDINRYLESVFANDLDVVVRAMGRRVDQITEKPLSESIEKDFKVLGEYDLDVTKKYKSSHEGYRRKTVRLKTPERKVIRCEVRAGSVLVKIKLDVLIPMNCVYVREKSAVKKSNPVQWVLLTTLPIITYEEVLKVVKYYKSRWLIEVYFKTLKSGCGVERSRLQSDFNLKNYITLMSIISARICMMTYLHRVEPDESCEKLLEKSEWEALYLYHHPRTSLPSKPPTLHQAITWIAKLGGFLGRKGDGYPGTLTLWEGMLRLHDIHESYLRFMTNNYG